MKKNILKGFRQYLPEEADVLKSEFLKYIETKKELLKKEIKGDLYNVKFIDGK